MRRKSLIAAKLAILLGMGRTGSMRAQDDENGPMSDLKFVVLKDFNGKPVRNAAVVLHPITKKGKQSKGGLELKGEKGGGGKFGGIPLGLVGVRGAAPGFQ